jgi:predicted peptidase
MMKRMVLAALAATVLAAGTAGLGGCNGARDTAFKVGEQSGGRGFMIRTLVRGERQRKYGLFVPLSYNPAQKYPVIIFLHGMGEGGNDAKAPLRVGLAPFVADRAENFPFICIFPQSPDGGWNENSESAKDVIAELDEVSRQYSVDQDRVSLTGLSTGGYGTWAIGAKYHDRFAALVPMGSSAMDMKDAEVLKDMPVRSYHNAMDMFAGVWNDTAMVDKLKSLGGDAQMTVYTAVGHDCWETAYSSGELFDWLLQQRRKGATAAAPRQTSSAAPAGRTGGAAVNTPY